MHPVLGTPTYTRLFLYVNVCATERDCVCGCVSEKERESEGERAGEGDKRVPNIRCIAGCCRGRERERERVE